MTQQIEMPETVNSPHVQFVDKVVNVPAMAQRQVPSAQKVQNNCEISTKQSLDKVVDVPAGTASPSVTIEGTRRLVEVARVIPQELVKPAGERTSVRERIRQFEVDCGSRCTSDPDPRAPVRFSLCGPQNNVRECQSRSWMTSCRK